MTHRFLKPERIAFSTVRELLENAILSGFKNLCVICVHQITQVIVLNFGKEVSKVPIVYHDLKVSGSL